MLNSGTTLAVADVRRDPRFAAETAEATGYVPQTILAAPLLAPEGVPDADEPLGVIEVLDPTARERDLELLALIGSLIAGMLVQQRPQTSTLEQAAGAVAARGAGATELAVEMLRAVARAWDGR